MLTRFNIPEMPQNIGFQMGLLGEPTVGRAKELSPNEIKSITKTLCAAYKNGEIEEKYFEDLIETLLFYFMEGAFIQKAKKVENKLSSFELKLFSRVQNM